MKTSKFLLPLGAIVLSALTATAAPLQPNQISEKANWFIHADLDDLRTPKVGTTLMEAIEKEHGRQLKAVKRMFSLNPFTDLHGITLYGNGEKDRAVMLINGTFDRAHVEDLIGASDGYKTSTHQDDTVHTWKDKQRTQHGAFLGDDLVIISEHKTLVVHALEVLNERKPSMEAGTFGTSPSAILLGFGRVIGETMVVLLVAGNKIAIPDITEGLGMFFQPAHTMTGIIAQEMGEVVPGSIHYRALFVVGILLFVISLALNAAAQRIVLKYKITAV